MIRSLCLALLLTANLFADYPRKTAVVEAVAKTKDAIVMLKVTKEKGTSCGTGVIINNQGFVVTNYHVVVDGQKILATIRGEEVEAEILYTASKRDLALLKLKKDKNWQHMEIGNSSDVMVGETVIAIGNPYGYDNTVSIGIVSAKERKIQGPKGNPMSDMIQHSAGINPGCSGGPLLNINGELIGLNTATREGAQGISFAISADTLKKVTTSLCGR